LKIHHIVPEEILPEKVLYPLYPPEDCGGPRKYENLKEIMADRKHEEHKDMKEWLGLDNNEEWDANYFDVNEMLKEFK